MAAIISHQVASWSRKSLQSQHQCETCRMQLMNLIPAHLVRLEKNGQWTFELCISTDAAQAGSPTGSLTSSYIAYTLQIDNNAPTNITMTVDSASPFSAHVTADDPDSGVQVFHMGWAPSSGSTPSCASLPSLSTASVSGPTYTSNPFKTTSPGGNNILYACAIDNAQNASGVISLPNTIPSLPTVTAGPGKTPNSPNTTADLVGTVQTQMEMDITLTLSRPIGIAKIRHKREPSSFAPE